MSRLQRRIVSETRAALEPLGYYEPEVTYDVQEGENWQSRYTSSRDDRCACRKSASP